MITDRIKRIFNRYGWKVYPNHITKIVTDSGLVKECVVVKRESLVKGESYVPILYAVLKENTTENRQKLLEWCNKKIIGNSSLYDIIFVDELPKTGAGKIDFTRVENYDKNHNEPVVQDNNEKNKCTKCGLIGLFSILNFPLKRTAQCAVLSYSIPTGLSLLNLVLIAISV